MTRKRRLLRGSYNNIIEIFENSSVETKIAGEDWYYDANTVACNIGALISKTADINKPYYKTETLIGAGVLSAFSPQTSWDRNITIPNIFAMDLFQPKGTTAVNYNKATMIVEKYIRGDYEENPITENDILDILGQESYKTKPFFMNILHPEGDYGVTIDRHALGVYLKQRPTTLQLSRVQGRVGNTQVQNSYRQASKLLGVHHNIVQATTWVEWRNNWSDYVKV